MMDVLISHWHCIIPAIAIFAALFLMRDKGDVTSEKRKEKSDFIEEPNKNHKSLE